MANIKFSIRKWQDKQKLLKEAAWDHTSGKPLPTLEDVQKAYEAKKHLQEGKVKFEGDEIFLGVQIEDEDMEIEDQGFSVEGETLEELHKSLLVAAKDVKRAIVAFKGINKILIAVR